MRQIARQVFAFLQNRRGGTAIEYGLILALIVMAIMATLVELGGVTSSMWTNVSAKVQAAG